MPRRRSLPEIDFSRVRPHKGSRNTGFEELCVSLFRHECGEPFEVRRIDGAGGDGGVEAYCRLANGDIVGLQAKYFSDRFGPPQWRQVRDSVSRAHSTRPSLAKYFVAVPRPLNPNTDKSWGAVQRWVRAEVSKRIRLVWWGESELVDLLTKPEHAGRLAYWFGCPQFDAAWLDERNAQARADLGERYTPTRHVQTESEEVVDAFVHADGSVHAYFELARKAWKSWREFPNLHKPEEISPALPALLDHCRSIGVEELPQLGDGCKFPVWKTACTAIDRLLEAVRAVDGLATELLQSLPPRDSRKPDADEVTRQKRERVRWLTDAVEKPIKDIYALHEFTERFECAAKKKLLVVGEAGSGKSHLLASAVATVRRKGDIALMVLGEYFTTAQEPWEQLISHIGWEGSVSDLLSALNCAAEATGHPALLVVDAVNESDQHLLWPNHLSAFANRIEKWPLVKLAVSCRSDFQEITLPDSIRRRRDVSWATVDHQGFGEAVFEAMTGYFAAYRVQVRDFPPMLPEFSNPLFLKTFCEAFEGESLPTGAITFDHVMQRRIDLVCRSLLKRIDCPAEICREAIDLLAREIESNEGHPVPKDLLRKRIDALLPGRGESKSLYRHLRSSGLFAEVGFYVREADAHEVRVRFAYERFSDYFVASRMLAAAGDARSLKEDWDARGLLGKWSDSRGYWRQRGLLSALTTLLPERFGVELVAWFLDGTGRRLAFEDFMASLSWRSGKSISSESREIFSVAQRNVPVTETINTLLRLATIPGHPWNMTLLHDRLKSKQLPDRELTWTIPVSKILRSDERPLPDLMVRWAFHVPPALMSDEQALLTGRLFAWLFGTNDRGFRRRVTIAAIRILDGRSDLAAVLVDDFHDVNDPYVIERVFAVAAGVASRERDTAKLAAVADAVWRRLFNAKCNPPHILVRHYGFMVMESARAKDCLPAGVSRSDYSPPYRSRWPRIWSQKKARSMDKDKDWREIVRSIEPEYGRGIGGYGDFGRYVMGAAVHHWTRVRRNRPCPKKGDKVSFDDLKARAWVLQRVVDLGWKPELFKEYEGTLAHGRQRTDIEDTKQERISKKYQWIALRELEGFLSDHFHMQVGWGGKAEEFKGAWQLFSRDFDPSQPLNDPADLTSVWDEDRPKRETNRWAERYPDPFRDLSLLANRSAWVRARPDDFHPLLENPSISELAGPALVISAHYSWTEKEPYPPPEPGYGEADTFTHVRAWLIPQSELADRLFELRNANFFGDGVSEPTFADSLGEYPWGERFSDLRKDCDQQGRWGVEFDRQYVHAACAYEDSDVHARLPSPQLMELLKLKWSGKDFEFVDDSGDLVAFTPYQGSETFASPCFVRRDKLLLKLREKGLTLMWGLVGERRCFDHEVSRSIADAMVTFSAVYSLSWDGTTSGRLTCHDVRLVPVER